MANTISKGGLSPLLLKKLQQSAIKQLPHNPNAQPLKPQPLPYDGGNPVANLLKQALSSGLKPAPAGSGSFGKVGFVGSKVAPNPGLSQQLNDIEGQMGSMNQSPFESALSAIGMDAAAFKNLMMGGQGNALASQQAEAVKRAREDGLKNSMRLLESGVNSSLNSLDQDYFLKGLSNSQEQVNRGINSGMAQDMDLRLAMSRQSAMGDVYGNAEVNKARIHDEMGRLEAEKMTMQNELANQYNNQSYDNFMDYWGMQEDTRRYDKNFALQEGEMTGNYVAQEARPILQQVLQAKQIAEDPRASAAQKQQANNILNNAYNKLGSMGMDTSSFGNGVSAAQTLGNMGKVNQTQSEKQRIFGNAVTEGELTGNYVSSDARGLINSVLQAKQIAADPKASRAAKDQAHIDAENARRTLASMGVDVSKISAGVGLTDAFNNVSSINPTLGKQQLDYNNALQVGELTGSYRDPKASGIIQELLQLKKTAEDSKKAGKGVHKDTVAQANALRNQLGAMGIDPNLFGGNLTYAQALANANKINKQTEGARQFNESSKLGWAELAEKGRQADLSHELGLGELELGKGQLGLGYDELGFKYEDLEFQRDKLETDAALEREGLSLEQARIDIDLIKQEQAYSKENGKTMSKAATTEAIGAISKSKSRSAAWKYISENTDLFAKNNVDIQAVMDALDSKYPSASKLFDAKQEQEMMDKLTSGKK